MRHYDIRRRRLREAEQRASEFHGRYMNERTAATSARSALQTAEAQRAVAEAGLGGVLAALGQGFEPLPVGVTMQALMLIGDGGWDMQRRILVGEVKRHYRDFVDEIFQTKLLPALLSARSLVEFDLALGAFAEIRVFTGGQMQRPRDRGGRR